MKLYISVDMEGATGIVRSEQIRAESPEYGFGRRMQTGDLLAALEGAFDGGATEVLINDSHDRMINISPSDLDHQPGSVSLISGSPKPLGMMEGIQGCDAAVFLCYHAKAGTTKAVLDHTISGRAIYQVFLNGIEMGETGLNAATAAQFGIPVIAVTGDHALCREAQALLGDDLVVCQVKEGMGHSTARCLPPDASHTLIRDGISKATQQLCKGKKTPPPMDIGSGTFRLDLVFHYASQADNAAIVPGTIRLDGRTVRVEGEGMDTMRQWAGALISLGGSVAF
ncbi:MAG: aminopeptidase [Dethiosulfovibrio peptidovorans]|nr:MAG: aminopeptidase [Dethiosulfovibrio peptidovorans]